MLISSRLCEEGFLAGGVAGESSLASLVFLRYSSKSPINAVTPRWGECGAAVLFQCASFAALPLPACGQVSERVARAPSALAPLPPALRRLQPHHAAGRRGGRHALSPPTAPAEEQHRTMTPAGACGCSVGAARPRRRCWRSHAVRCFYFLARASDAPPPVVCRRCCAPHELGLDRRGLRQVRSAAPAVDGKATSAACLFLLFLK